MTIKIEQMSREQIARFLPDAISKAIKSYDEFMQSPAKKKNVDDASAFEKHHKACRVAIAHIELLLKLARWADLPDAGTADHGNQIVLSAILQEAEECLAGYEDGNE